MSKPFYTDYVRHCLRFYVRNTNKPRFNTEVDKTNWYACQKAIEKYSDRDRDIIRRVYGMRDTLVDNVYEASQIYLIDQNDIWDMLKELEHTVAKKRGLI
jgi:viroplasmin and RNaseH domain-containing protein